MVAVHENSSLRAAMAKVMRFALVSGVGLALDVGLFLALNAAGMRAGYANLVSAAVAVTFVYFVSTRRVFNYDGRFLLALFWVYFAYQALAVAAASWAVDALVAMELAPLLSKGLILPVTFSANYLVMDFLTKSRR